MDGGQDQTIFRMEADVLFARLNTWLRKHVGDDGSLFARLSTEGKKNALEMFSRFIGSVLVASDLSMQMLERTDTIRELLTKCAFLTELLASNSEAAPSPHTQRFLTNFRTKTRALHSLFILVSSKDYVMKLVNEDKIMLLGALPLHLWGEALISYAETSLRFWKPQCIQCLKLAEDRLTKCLFLSSHRHQSSYLLGLALLHRAKLDTPSSSKALLEKAYRVFYFTAQHLPLFPGYLHALARVAALLDREGECQQLLKSCIASGTESPLALLDDADFDRFRGKKWFYELAECAMLADPLASNHVYTDDKQYNRLQNNLVESGFAMKKLIELFSWLPISSGQSQIRAGEESENTRKQKERLQQRLELYQLKPKRDIPGDGNCQMHAVSDQLYNTISRSGEVRKMVVDWLQKNRDLQLPNGAILHQFVHDRKWEDYCAAMAKDGCWGDHLTLLAISEIFGVVISIISSVEGDNYITEIYPTEKKMNKVLLLSHYAEFHYGSLAHIVDTPMCSVE